MFLLVTSPTPGPQPELEQELRAQLPATLATQVMLWSGEEVQLSRALEPCSRMLRASGRGLLLQTELRCLESLHGDWQARLEGLRRGRLDGLVRRTQWLVAAGVFAAPMPSVDLLVLAVANGLMLKEMAELWDCPWQLAQLREAATELAKAALALGVTEWTSQALLSAMRLEGTTWLVGGALQALSAAYLTRVVAHAMADVLALSSGVPEMDLQAIRQQAPCWWPGPWKLSGSTGWGFSARGRPGGAARRAGDWRQQAEARNTKLLHEALMKSFMKFSLDRKHFKAFSGLMEVFI